MSLGQNVCSSLKVVQRFRCLAIAYRLSTNQFSFTDFVTHRFGHVAAPFTCVLNASMEASLSDFSQLNREWLR